jgi:tetratricopeptide (TPR) repeat protein
MVVIASLLLASCGPRAELTPRGDLDRAIEQYVAGEYRSAVAGFEKALAATEDDAVRREAYTYLGRAYMALGQTDEAVTAFTMGARYGDRGVCVAYLETLKQYVGGSPKGLHISEALTRSQLALAILRIMDGGAEPAQSLDPNAPTPIRQLEARHWMIPLADGTDHADDAVTPAALYVIVARILADAKLAGRVHDVMPAGYRVALGETRAVSGAEALAVLERTRSLKEQHGR